jgi:hypothetical protein
MGKKLKSTRHNAVAIATVKIVFLFLLKLNKFFPFELFLGIDFYSVVPLKTAN